MTDLSLNLDVVSDIGALDAMAADWDACLEEHGGDIYHSTAWLSVWWAHFGKRSQPALFCLRVSGRLVGVLPFAIERLGPVRLARLAGADPNYPFLGFGIAPDHASAGWAAVLQHLTGALACDLVSLAPISGLAAPHEAVAGACASSGLALLRDDASREHSIMRLPEDFDAYMAVLSKSRRREYRRDLKKMVEAFQLEQTVSHTAEALDRFIADHNAQWQATGRQGNFDDWPGSRAFYHDVMAALEPTGRAMIVAHLGDGRHLSSQFAFRFGDRAYWRLIARSLDEDLASFGLGRVGLVERVRLLIEAKVRLVEAGAGEYEYKTSYGGEQQALHRILVVRDAAFARLRARLLLNWADFLDLIYYRGWFLKLAPRARARLKLKHRPLWSGWIRTRI